MPSSSATFVQKYRFRFGIWEELVEVTSILPLESLECCCWRWCYCLWRSRRCELHFHRSYSCFSSSPSQFAMKTQALSEGRILNGQKYFGKDEACSFLSGLTYEIFCKTPVSASKHSKGSPCIHEAPHIVLWDHFQSLSLCYKGQLNNSGLNCVITSTQMLIWCNWVCSLVGFDVRFMFNTWRLYLAVIIKGRRSPPGAPPRIRLLSRLFH